MRYYDDSILVAILYSIYDLARICQDVLENLRN